MTKNVTALKSIEDPALPASVTVISHSSSVTDASTVTDPFNGLGLFGLSSIAPLVVASLVTEEPLLLIGAHGTAKSLLLNRIAEALGLSFRHYNASLLNFDDLVGFPLPGKDGSLNYVKTPAAVWGAEAVIFDEISRCRPEIQNKLFPIIHEKKVQGLALEGLRYRWAAMNPPSTEEDDNGYLGSEALDTALADRFALIVQMPLWDQLTSNEQISVIQLKEEAINPEKAKDLVEVIKRAQFHLSVTSDNFALSIASYVQTLTSLLSQAGIQLSPRRNGMIYRSVLAVIAASSALDPDRKAADAALLAVKSSLPQRAQGKVISEVKLLSAHREAWRLACVKPDDPLKVILCAKDPLVRYELAVATSSLNKTVFSQIIADIFTQVSIGTRQALVVHLFESGGIGRLNAAIAGQSAELYQELVIKPNYSETLHASNARFRAWSAVKDLLSRLDPERDERAHLRANALASSFFKKELSTPDDAKTVFDDFASIDRRLNKV